MIILPPILRFLLNDTSSYTTNPSSNVELPVIFIVPSMFVSPTYKLPPIVVSPSIDRFPFNERSLWMDKFPPIFVEFFINRFPPMDKLPFNDKSFSIIEFPPVIREPLIKTFLFKEISLLSDNLPFNDKS